MFWSRLKMTGRLVMVGKQLWLTIIVLIGVPLFVVLLVLTVNNIAITCPFPSVSPDKSAKKVFTCTEAQIQAGIADGSELAEAMSYYLKGFNDVAAHTERTYDERGQTTCLAMRIMQFDLDSIRVFRRKTYFYIQRPKGSHISKLREVIKKDLEAGNCQALSR